MVDITLLGVALVLRAEASRGDAVVLYEEPYVRIGVVPLQDRAVGFVATDDLKGECDRLVSAHKGDFGDVDVAVEGRELPDGLQQR